MADRFIIQGHDVSVVATGPAGPVMLGGFQRLEATVTHDTEPYKELNEQIARELTGDIAIEGTLRTGWQDVDAATKLFGTDQLIRGKRIVPPKFTVTATVDAPEKGISNRRAQFQNVSLQTFNLGAGEGKTPVSQDTRFKAEGLVWL